MSREGASPAMPIILPATRPLRAASRVEFGAWVADKLREARALGPAPRLITFTTPTAREDRERIEQALLAACPAALIHVPQNIECEPQDDSPWPFSLLELKARLR